MWAIKRNTQWLGSGTGDQGQEGFVWFDNIQAPEVFRTTSAQFAETVFSKAEETIDMDGASVEEC